MRYPNLNRRDINRINLIINKITKKVGRNSLKFFKNKYNKQGWEDTSFIKWSALKERTKKYKRRKGTLKKGILKDSGDLYRSLRIKRYGRAMVVLGTSGDYGIHHQRGTPKMAQRKYLYNSKKLNKENMKIINKEILQLFKIKRGTGR